MIYNEWDKRKAAWLRQLIAAALAAQMTGWPTVVVSDHKARRGVQEKPKNVCLLDAARVADCASTQGMVTGWPTVTVRDYKDRALDLSKNPVKGLLGKVCLTAGWATPSKSDSVGATGGGQGSSLRTDAAGTRLSGPDASTPGTDAKPGGQLNPGLCRWLMGYPPEFCESAVTAMQSFPRSRRRSSKPSQETFDDALRGGSEQRTQPGDN